MREKLRSLGGGIAAPPPELRRFERDHYAALGEDGPAPAERRGCDVFADRAAWIEARREWESQHGISIGEWHRQLCAEALARCVPSLPAFYAMTGPYDTEDEDWEDPREVTADQRAARERVLQLEARSLRGELGEPRGAALDL